MTALLNLAERVEAAGISAAKDAVSKEPWAGQYQSRNMQFAANALTVAAHLRALSHQSNDRRGE